MVRRGRAVRAGIPTRWRRAGCAFAARAGGARSIAGFVLSDHADWPDLLRAIDETGAETVWVHARYRAPLVRWLEEHGKRALAADAPLRGGAKS